MVEGDGQMLAISNNGHHPSLQNHEEPVVACGPLSGCWTSTLLASSNPSKDDSVHLQDSSEYTPKSSAFKFAETHPKR